MMIKEITSEKVVVFKPENKKKAGNPDLKTGNRNPYYPELKNEKMSRYVVRIKNKPKKMDKLSNQEKIKLIKSNLFMRTDKLAKKAGFKNISSLYQFCSRNKISLSPNKHILNYIKKNIATSSVSFMKKVTGYTKQDLYNIMGENGISTEKFRGAKNLVKAINTKTKINNKTKSKISKDNSDDDIESKKEIPYEKISHEHLNGILMAYDKVAQAFIRDLGALSVGEALCIKKENWTLKINPYFYFSKKVLNNSPMKVKVKELNGDYYVIRLK